MTAMNRRTFLKMSAGLTAALGLSGALKPQVAEALAELASGTAPVLWLEGQCCSGCSVSILNSESPGIAELLTRYISVIFHQTVSAATGHVAVELVKQATEQGGYLLVVEGSVPAKMPEACRVGEMLFEEQLLAAAKTAKAVVALGICATDGGIPAAENNPTGAQSVVAFLKAHSVDVPVISLPGCPVHPDWLVGTLVHVLKFGLPALDGRGRPLMYYGKKIHDQCTRFADYEREHFAEQFGDDGCYFKLGCAGPITGADCPVRHWNGGTNYCINAGSPCIGCTSEEFASKRSFALYTPRAARKEVE